LLEVSLEFVWRYHSKLLPPSQAIVQSKAQDKKSSHVGPAVRNSTYVTSVYINK
jgi:hypothetical protein